MKSPLLKSFVTFLFNVLIITVSAQTATIRGKVISGGKPAELASIKRKNMLVIKNMGNHR